MLAPKLPVLLQPGDVFAVTSDKWLANRINDVSKFWSDDNQSRYSHSGIIITHHGRTMEALKRLDFYYLSQYVGQPIIIARPSAPVHRCQLAIDLLVKEHINQAYPWWRILLHTVQPLAKLITYKGKYVVCSELVAKYLHYLKVRHPIYTGVTPDMLADEWRRWKDFEIIYEGVWK
jgi:hypothetical protein